MSERFIRKICFSVLISLTFLIPFAKAQDDLANMNLSDKQKFKKAIKDAKELEPNEVEKLQLINVADTKVSVVTLTENSCDDYKKMEKAKHFSGKDVWITLSLEVKSAFQSKKSEFADKENRLKKLLGLRYDKTYRCLVELEVGASKITRPSSFFNLQGDLLKPINSTIKNENYDSDYPFTDLGYSCDWYYGDGCRYGLTEFFIRKGNDSLIKKACNISEYLEEKC